MLIRGYVGSSCCYLKLISTMRTVIGVASLLVFAVVAIVLFGGDVSQSCLFDREWEGRDGLVPPSSLVPHYLHNLNFVGVFPQAIGGKNY